MPPFSLFAPAKINLALHVLGRRSDGYHELDSIVAFADVGDQLTFLPGEPFDIVAEGPFAAKLPEPSANIIAKAHAAVTGILQTRGVAMPQASVRIVKNLPVASGIGGGSSNAAAAMKGFLRLAGIPDLDDEIMAAGLRLGADVPVCLRRAACRMRGIGERITPIPFAPRHAILVNPLVEVPTPAVFKTLGLSPGQSYGEEVTDETDVSAWRNDLAGPAIALAPVIGEVIAALERLPGVTKAFMSGSGATCVALHDGVAEKAWKGRLDPAWWTAPAILS
jgi:4-diphosphocytidyl-2-C-methyl-D-erythritol kinase